MFFQSSPQPHPLIEARTLDNPAPLGIDPLIREPTLVLRTAAPEDIVLDPQQHGIDFLHAQLTHHAQITVCNKIASSMATPLAARKFLARLLIENIMLGRSPYKGPYPDFLTQPQPPRKYAVLQAAELLHNRFKVITDGRERAYIKNCFWDGVKDNSGGPGSIANQTNEVVQRLVNENAPFIVCADEIRLEYIGNLRQGSSELAIIEEERWDSEDDYDSAAE